MTGWIKEMSGGQTMKRCVGIGASKTLAKLANHIAKKQPGFNGVCDLAAMPLAETDALLSGKEVGEVWGVGRRIGSQLHGAGSARSRPCAIRHHAGCAQDSAW
ncbi:hypothetical protein [Nitrosospira briensis]|uniref:hypothetical protein n=1 Tax=Nitrosospira briensis TaxID=35799 RepID=UPI0015A59B60|nr:hypothetical protein [Nitrosospira briensis]